MNYIYQNKNKAMTAWILTGVPGTGKGLFIHKILKPLFGEQQVPMRALEHIEEQLFNKLDVPFRQSKEEVWETLSKKIDEQRVEHRPAKVIPTSWIRYAAAAVICLLIGLTVFFRFHVETFKAKKGIKEERVLSEPPQMTIYSGTNSAFNTKFFKEIYKFDYSMDTLIQNINPLIFTENKIDIQGYKLIFSTQMTKPLNYSSHNWFLYSPIN